MLCKCLEWPTFREPQFSAPLVLLQQVLNIVVLGSIVSRLFGRPELLSSLSKHMLLALDVSSCGFAPAKSGGFVVQLFEFFRVLLLLLGLAVRCQTVVLLDSAGNLVCFGPVGVPGSEEEVHADDDDKTKVFLELLLVDVLVDEVENRLRFVHVVLVCLMRLKSYRWICSHSGTSTNSTTAVIGFEKRKSKV